MRDAEIRFRLDRLLRRFDGLIVMSEQEVAESDAMSRGKKQAVEWADSQATLTPFDRTLGIGSPSDRRRTKPERKKTRRTDHQRLFKGLARCRHVVRDLRQSEPRQRQCFGIVGSVRNGGVSMSNGLVAILGPLAAPDEADFMAPGGITMSKRVVRLESQRLVEQLQCFFGTFRH